MARSSRPCARCWKAQTATAIRGGKRPRSSCWLRCWSTSGPEAASGYQATSERLGRAEVENLTDDLEAAVDMLTAGRLAAFRTVTVEDAVAGTTVQVFRRGAIVVGRFHGVEARAGTLGYGVRTTRQGSITAAAVLLDRDFDKQSGRRRLLRTHELGHALGYNHVESRRSVMNPTVGSEITDLDRRVIRLAFPPAHPPLAPARDVATR